jgi:hypothetical protein
VRHPPSGYRSSLSRVASRDLYGSSQSAHPRHQTRRHRNRKPLISLSGDAHPQLFARPADTPRFCWPKSPALILCVPVLVFPLGTLLGFALLTASASLFSCQVGRSGLQLVPFYLLSHTNWRPTTAARGPTPKQKGPSIVSLSISGDCSFPTVACSPLRPPPPSFLSSSPFCLGLLGKS